MCQRSYLNKIYTSLPYAMHLKATSELLHTSNSMFSKISTSTLFYPNKSNLCTVRDQEFANKRGIDSLHGFLSQWQPCQLVAKGFWHSMLSQNASRWNALLFHDDFNTLYVCPISFDHFCWTVVMYWILHGHSQIACGSADVQLTSSHPPWSITKMTQCCTPWWLSGCLLRNPLNAIGCWLSTQSRIFPVISLFASSQNFSYSHRSPVIHIMELINDLFDGIDNFN